MSSYDNYLSTLKEEDSAQNRLISSLSEAATTNPDEFAHMKALSKAASISIEAVPHYKDEATQAKYLGDVGIGKLWKDAPLTSDFLSIPDNAKLASDDVENLSGFEQLVRSFKRGLTSGLRGQDASTIEESAGILNAIAKIERGETLSVNDPYASMFSGVGSSPQNLKRFREAAQANLAENAVEFKRRSNELKGLEATGPLAKFYQAQGWGDSLGELFSSPVTIGLNIVSESTGTLAPTLPLIAGSGMAGGGRALAAMVGASSTSTEYATAIAEELQRIGVDPTNVEAVRAAVASPEFAEVKRKAQIKAAVIGAFDAATASVAGVRVRPSALGNLAAQTGIQAAGGAAGEALGSVASGQEINASAVLAEAFGEIPGAVTDVATMSANKMLSKEQDARRATQTAELLTGMNQLAEASRLRERDTATAATFFQSVLDDGRDAVFITPEALAQSGMAEQIAAAIPAVREQLQAAAEVGTDIRLPIAELMATVPGEQLAQSIIPHVSDTPGGFTQTTAQEYLQSGQAQELQTLVDNLLGEQANDDAFKQSQAAVKQAILDNLNAVGRFTAEKNEADAMLASSYAAVRAAQLGILPEQFFAKHMVTVQGESVLGEAYDQNTGPFGPMLSEFKGDAQGAIAKLMEMKQGEAVGALHHPEIGDIDLVWGEAGDPANGYKGGYGLAHIAAKHPEIVSSLQDILTAMHVKRKSANRVILESDDHKAAVSLNWLGAEKKWVLSAYAKEKGSTPGATIHAAEVGAGDSLLDASNDIVDQKINEFHQAAYHGSPYKFDKFSLEHLGKGEGAQAYGWGLYFAGAKKVAEWYRENLSAQEISFNGKKAVTVRQKFTTAQRKSLWSALKKDAAVNALIESDSRAPGNINSVLDMYVRFAGDWARVKDFYSEVSDYFRPQYQAILDVLEGKLSSKSKGQLYQVDIPEDDTMLLWDKPLSEQPEKVRAALKQAGVSLDAKQLSQFTDALLDALTTDNDVALPKEPSNPSGEQVYKRIIRMQGSAEAASKYLNTFGISGIKYLDGTSRAAGDGSYNYVIFDDASIEILNTYYQSQSGANNRGSIAFSNFEIFDADGKSLGYMQANDSQQALERAKASGKYKGAARAGTEPVSLITLLKGADLSTFLHESGHYFFETDIKLAGEIAQEARIHGYDTLTEGEKQILADVSALLSWHGIQGSIDQQLAQWATMDFEEKRTYHERTAESFEVYLFEGKAPSIELQAYFQRFRAWLLDVYKQLLKAFNGDLKKAFDSPISDEVRQVFDRMLATTEQIKLAEQARSMLPLFASAEQAGMTPDEFAAYQATGLDASQAAIEELQAKGMRDMQWQRNYRAKALRQLQRQAKEERNAVQMDARRQVMSEPVYRAWQFLTAKLTADDKIEPPKPPKSDRNTLDETMDSLFVAIAKLGGLNKEEVVGTWGIDPADKPASGIVGKPLWRIEGGLSIDGMREALAQYGYVGEELAEFEEKFKAELRGDTQYSNAYAPEQFVPEGVANPAGLSAGRFALQGLQDIGLPVEIINHLKALKMTAKDGLHPDLVAEMFGFTSGDELTRTLAAAEAPKDAIEGLTDRLMLERHGELATPDAIERAADKAIHNEVRARMVATELAALEKATGKPKTLTTAAKQYAAAMIARLKVRNIRPGQYAAAEVRAAKAAVAASKSGDTALAAAEKRNQLVNLYATRAAYDAQDEIAAGVRYLKKFDGEYKNLDADYLSQIQALLARFDLRQQSLKAIDRQVSLRTWVQAQLNAGEVPLIAESLLTPSERAAYVSQIESRDADGELVYADDEERIKLLADAIDRSATRSYKDLTVEELRGLIDTVKQIEHLGRLKHTILTNRENANYEAVRDEVAGGIAAEAASSGKNTRTANDWLGQKLQAIKQFGAAHIKVATWARIMDGGKDNGPVWRYLVQPANERASQETTMRAEATAQLDAIMRPILAKVPMMDKVGKGKFFPSINDSLNWQERFAILLNLGNESNLQRLLAGKGWTMAQIKPIIDGYTAEELRAAQAVWDHFESYRPLIAAKELRVTGKEPEWIPARQITFNTTDGQTVTLRGGYFPVVYDPRVNLKASQHSSAEEAKNLLKASYSAATTRRSFTKARVEEVHGRPLLLNMQGLYSGVNDVIHDLAWHEWVMDANKLLRSKTIDTAIREYYGPEVKREFEKWRDDIVAGNRRLDHAIEKAAGVVRQSVTASALTFNLVSAAMQPLGIANSISRVGATWIGKGLARYVAAPVAATREAQEKSEWLANRTRTRFRELNELRNQVQGQTAVKELMGRYGYWLMMRTQLMVDVPTWWAGYEKAIAEGHDEATAINLADQGVKDSQGGGEEVDQSGVERGGPLIKLFTAFYGFMGTTLNVAYLNKATEKSKARMATNMLLVLGVPAVLGALLKDALIPGDDGDEDELAKKLLIEQLSFLAGLVAFGREFSPLIKSVAGEAKGQSYSGPAGLRLIPDTIKLGQQAGQGEFDDAFRKAFVNILGDLTGLPSVQINRTITGAEALAEGETENPAALVFGFQTKH